MEVKDYTESDDYADADQHYLIPRHPFRLLITGPSSCGKTNLLLNFIYDYLKFDTLYVCAKDIEEPMYSRLKDNYTMFEGIEQQDIKNCKAKNKNKLRTLFNKFKKDTLFSSHLTDFVTVDDLDRSVKNLVVFDDCVTEKDQRSIEDFFIRGRKKNATIVYLSQSYYSTPINIRRNCNYFIFFNLQPREIQQIIREVDGSREFKNMYKSCVQKPYDFFMLDLVTPSLRYRKQFLPINKT